MSTNMEHVDVLRYIAASIAACDKEAAALDAAIASLSATQPPAEAPADWIKVLDSVRGTATVSKVFPGDVIAEEYDTQQPAAVDEEMVRKVAKAINAEMEGTDDVGGAWKRLGSNERKLRDRMARAALAAQHGGSDNDR